MCPQFDISHSENKWAPQLFELVYKILSVSWTLKFTLILPSFKSRKNHASFYRSSRNIFENWPIGKFVVKDRSRIENVNWPVEKLLYIYLPVIECGQNIKKWSEWFFVFSRLFNYTHTRILYLLDGWEIDEKW